ncbi:MAG TPA: DUF4129 domain-containing protein [Candidatus Didemnitutus sp.]|nr:DUF4129 domain-containing protein [Candidatus Didemnitutus sp.]
MAAREHESGTPVVELLEEAVHLLRSRPGELAIYYLATGPFALGFLFFWSYVTWFAPGDGAVAWGALLLVLLFGVMKVGQRHFMRRLLAVRLGEPPPAFSWRRLPGEWSAQMCLQAPGLVLVPLVMIATIPFGWIYAYFQNALILPADRPGDLAACRGEAWNMALLWPGQNHRGLAIIAVFWLAMFLNIAVSFYLLPILATRMLGLHTIFEHGGMMLFNSTYLLLIASLTHLLVDPLVKAFYLLRVFYGRSQRNGDEVRVALARESGSGSWRRAAVTVALLAALAGPATGRLRAAEPPPPAVLPAADLDRALDRALEQPDFRWRLRPLPPPPDQKPKGLLAGFFESAADTVREMVGMIIRVLKKILDWISDLGPKPNAPTAESSSSGTGVEWMMTLQIVAYVLLGVVIIVLALVALKIFRRGRPRASAVAAMPSESVPDLTDENVQASRLPADGWLELAREQMRAGQWRLALRALFLATLARLAEDRLLTLARHKTNLDYERELRRRALSRVELVTDFHGRRRSFEDVWYGRQPAAAEAVTSWLSTLEKKA